MTTFEKIKIIANKRGISLKKLGPKAGLSENTIYSWQKKSPGIKSLEKVYYSDYTNPKLATLPNWLSTYGHWLDMKNHELNVKNNL